MDAILPQYNLTAKSKLLKELRRGYLKYLKSPRWMSFAKGSYNVPWWNLLGKFVVHMAVAMKRGNYEILGEHGELVLAICLMRNSGLQKKGTSAPALMLGTYNIARSGFERLLEIAQEMDATRIDDDSAVGAWAFETMADEEFHEFRRRSIHPDLDPGGQFFLYDAMMRWDDLPELEPGIPFPYTIMLALPYPMEAKYIFAILPKKLRDRAFKFLKSGK